MAALSFRFFSWQAGSEHLSGAVKRKRPGFGAEKTSSPSFCKVGLSQTLPSNAHRGLKGWVSDAGFRSRIHAGPPLLLPVPSSACGWSRIVRAPPPFPSTWSPANATPPRAPLFSFFSFFLSPSGKELVRKVGWPQEPNGSNQNHHWK